MRAYVVVHLDRGWSQRSRNDVSRESHKPQSGRCVLEIHKDYVHIGRGENADKSVAEKS